MKSFKHYCSFNNIKNNHIMIIIISLVGGLWRFTSNSKITNSQTLRTKRKQKYIMIRISQDKIFSGNMYLVNSQSSNGIACFFL